MDSIIAHLANSTGLFMHDFLISTKSQTILFPMMIWFRLVVFNATFNNISVISWRSVLLVEETGVPGENHRTGASH
jgi:hypothetical protein